VSSPLVLVRSSLFQLFGNQLSDLRGGSRAETVSNGSKRAVLAALAESVCSFPPQSPSAVLIPPQPSATTMRFSSRVEFGG
jgi:hypothetical protein